MASINIKNLPPEARANLPKPGSVNGLGKFMFGAGIVMDATNRISNGEGVVSSVAKAGVSALAFDTLFALAGPYALPIMLGGTALAVGGQLLHETTKQNAKNMGYAYMGNSARGSKVVNSEAAATMRQRGMAMINQNGEATRSVLGSEARAYFRNTMTQYK